MVEKQEPSVKTVRISIELHKELVKIMGQIAPQVIAKKGKMPDFEDVIRELVDNYKKSK